MSPPRRGPMNHTETRHEAENKERRTDQREQEADHQARAEEGRDKQGRRQEVGSLQPSRSAGPR